MNTSIKFKDLKWFEKENAARNFYKSIFKTLEILQLFFSFEFF